jgi:hypothetical protein
MPAIQVPIHVEMEDGRIWDAVVDQRDYAKWEIQPFYGDDRPQTMCRFLAYAASLRTGKLDKDVSWPAFNASCIEATDVIQEQPELDPTSRTQSGDS